MKVCSQCKIRKINALFYNDKRRNDGLTPACRECLGTQLKTYVRERPQAVKDKQRRYQLKRDYGITEEQYQELFNKHGGCCWVCGRHQNQFKKRLAVEHNHRTHEIRGLACDYCNRFIIGRNNDPELLLKAAEYLKQGTGWLVPIKKSKRKSRKPKRGTRGSTKGRST